MGCGWQGKKMDCSLKKLDQLSTRCCSCFAQLTLPQYPTIYYKGDKGDVYIVRLNCGIARLWKSDGPPT